MDVRVRIADAARDLFADRGYERTTVDAIAERAGIARRTFFRYFRSKDDVIFPDHEEIERRVAAFFASSGHLDPIAAVCAAARIVFASYVQDREVSVQRYLVARSVPALRDKESASGTRYARIFGRYLRERYGDSSDAALRGEVGAAAVIAAHNQVLREWLRGRGEGDPLPTLDAAFAWVCATLGREPSAPAVPPVAGTPDRRVGPPEARRSSGDGAVAASAVGVPVAEASGSRGCDGEVVVAVFRSDQPWDAVVRRISGSL